MQTELSIEKKRELAKIFGYELAVILAVETVEGAGKGFDQATGKILIQFEPKWFEKYTDTWINNGVRPQPEEWQAFNQAFKINPDAAMLSTSIGSMQVMGFNFKRAGYGCVGDFYDACKDPVTGLYNQLKAGLNFIRTNAKLHAAALAKDWRTFAYYYNGPKYEDHDYHLKLDKYYKSFQKKYPA